MTLVVSDDEYTAIASAYKAYGDALQARIDSYRKILNETAATAICDGQTANNYDIFALQVDTLGTKAKDLCDRLDTEINTFVEEIDQADSDIY